MLLIVNVFLSETEGSQNWEAVAAKAAESDKKRFYINVCHKIIQEGEARSCPEDAAICAIGQCTIRDYFLYNLFSVLTYSGSFILSQIFFF